MCATILGACPGAHNGAWGSPAGAKPPEPARRRPRNARRRGVRGGSRPARAARARFDDARKA
ncbi:hypothetical protein GBP346_B0854 [Burkholderia pseudomallei MSHR346]|nr:hypothetical protein GBP346_B0854 [Burkholderia pseudomallei MSHR346]